MKGTVKVAYWDTEQSGRRPTMLGEFKGTPTIRLYVPKPKQGNSNRKKQVLDYQYERKAKDMKQYLDQNMPNYAEAVRGDVTSFVEKADRHGLPKVLLFTSKARTSSLVKYLTTEFRRRLLLAEIYPTSKNQDLMKEYGVSADDGNLPALFILRDDGQEPIRYDGADFTKRKLQRFLSDHALAEPVVAKKKEAPKVEEERKKKVKEEF
mmetsp:Transcript_12317/g.20398  ORF Transcript_12317/g.20398 Transcript_12317/m.20398 type:complete len:208 (-) Transcript_12317:1348-1971(-)